MGAVAPPLRLLGQRGGQLVGAPRATWQSGCYLEGPPPHSQACIWPLFDLSFPTCQKPWDWPAMSQEPVIVFLIREFILPQVWPLWLGCPRGQYWGDHSSSQDPSPVSSSMERPISASAARRDLAGRVCVPEVSVPPGAGCEGQRSWAQRLVLSRRKGPSHPRSPSLGSRGRSTRASEGAAGVTGSRRHHGRSRQAHRFVPAAAAGSVPG